MKAQNMYMSGDAAIDLSAVADVVQPPDGDGIQTQDTWIMVLLRDGTFVTVKGHAETEAFMQAMDNHLGADLI